MTSPSSHASLLSQGSAAGGMTSPSLAFWISVIGFQKVNQLSAFFVPLFPGLPSGFQYTKNHFFYFCAGLFWILFSYMSRLVFLLTWRKGSDLVGFNYIGEGSDLPCQSFSRIQNSAGCQLAMKLMIEFMNVLKSVCYIFGTCVQHNNRIFWRRKYIRCNFFC